MINKPLPNNVDAEKELLSMIFLKNDLIVELISKIKPTDFYSGVHLIIYTKMIQMYSKDIFISLTTLANTLDTKALQSIGGVTYLAELGSMSASTNNFKFLLNLIKSLADRRLIIKNCHNAVQEAFETDVEPSEIINKLENSFINMNKIDEEGTVNAEELMQTTFDSIEKAHKNGGKITGISTGYSNLDLAMNGLVKQDLVLIAARPSMGKTALIVNILNNIPKEYNCLVHELEMAKEKIGIRLLAAKSLKNVGALTKGQVNDSDFTLLTEKCNQIAIKNNLYLNCKAGLTFGEIRAEAKKIKLKHGLDILVVDHIGKIKPDNPKATKNDQLGQISEGLKCLAKDLNICVVALSQLSRECEKRTDKHPQLSDLRDSGCLEQDADTILLLYREDYYAEREDKESNKPNVFEVMVAKNRDGECGMLELNYSTKCQLITEIGHKDCGNYNTSLFEKR